MAHNKKNVKLTATLPQNLYPSKIPISLLLPAEGCHRCNSTMLQQYSTLSHHFKTWSASHLLFGIQSCHEPLWLSLGFLKPPTALISFVLTASPFMWHLVRSLDPRVSTLENVRRQVHGSILRPVIHLFVQVWEPSSRSGIRLAEKETKGPVAGI